MKDEGHVYKEILNFEEKSPNLDVYGLNWIFNCFIGVLIARKLIFKSIRALIRRNLSSEAKIYFLGIY